VKSENKNTSRPNIYRPNLLQLRLTLVNYKESINQLTYRCRRRWIRHTENVMRLMNCALLTACCLRQTVALTHCPLFCGGTRSLHGWDMLLPPPRRVRSIAFFVTVCLSVRSHISKATRHNFTKFSKHITCGRIARSLSDDNAIRYVLSVCGSWMTSCFHIIGQI